MAGQSTNFSVTRSFIPVTIAFASGIAWNGIAFVPVNICWPLVAVLGVRLTLARQIQRWSSPYLLLAFFFLIGGLHSNLKTQLPEAPNHIRQLITERQEASIIGTLLRSPQVSSDKTTILVNTSQIIFPDSIHPTTGLVRLAINGQIDQDIRPGDSIICRVWHDCVLHNAVIWYNGQLLGVCPCGLTLCDVCSLHVYLPVHARLVWTAASSYNSKLQDKVPIVVISHRPLFLEVIMNGYGYGYGHHSRHPWTSFEVTCTYVRIQ